MDITVHVERSALGARIEAPHAGGLTHRFPEMAERLLAAGRREDVDDVLARLASGKVDVDEATDRLDQHEQALGPSDLVEPFRALVGGVGSPRSG